LLGLYVVTAILVIVSFIADRKKTLQGIKIGLKKFRKILPDYLKILIFVAVILFFSESLIAEYLGQDNTFLGMVIGLILGSVTIMPGFIAYPLAGVLVEKGVLYMIVAAFVTTLMMVGLLTYPLEKEYLGVRATLLRNGGSFLIAVIISLTIGFCYGEILS
jgi:uncharacterized membrane protein YraQ (UPF0718 family)